MNMILFIMFIFSIFIVFSKKLIHSLIFLCLFSGLLVTAMSFLHAPDIAITEAALGTGLTTCVYLIAIKKTRRIKNDKTE